MRNEGPPSYAWKAGEQNIFDGRRIHFHGGSEVHVAVVAETRQTVTPAQAGGDSLLEWSQPFSEGPIHEPLPSNQWDVITQEEEPQATFPAKKVERKGNQRTSTLCSLINRKIRIAKHAE